MKKLVLAFILFLSAATLSHAQKEQPRDILKTSLRRMSGGKVMTGFELQKTFESLGKTSANPFQADAAKDLMKQLIDNAPDSLKRLIEAEMKLATARFSSDMIAMYQGNIDQLKVDFKSDRAVTIRLRKNSLRGAMDTSRYVLDPAKSKMADLLTDNPIALLQLLTADTTELHYTGLSLVNDEENHVIQAKTGSGWLDIYVDKKSGLMTQTARSHVDNDPLIGSKPEHYRDFTKYLNYQKADGFLLPGMVEEISTSINVDVKYRLEWVSINAPLFKQGAQVITPKGNGTNSEERQYLYNKTEDSTWKARKAEGVLTIYEQSFSKDGVSIFVMNPGVKEEWDPLHVFYYLPKQKLIYYKGIHSELATGSRNVSLVEKLLYDFISAENLNVDHLIITNSFIENPPLEISFADFERRMKSGTGQK